MVVAGARKSVVEPRRPVIVLPPGDGAAALRLWSRYYNPEVGRFNRLDPFAGNTQDPLSLHKYNYAESDPVNNIDPSGLFSVAQTISVAGLTGLFNGLISGGIAAVTAESGQKVAAFSDAFAKGTISGAITATILIRSGGKVSIPVANAIGGAGGSIIIDGIRYGADVYFGNRTKEAGRIFRDAAIDGLAGLIVGAAFGQFTKGGDDIAEAIEGYAKALNNANFKILPRTGSLATEADKLKAVIARNVAMADVNKAYQMVALEIGSLFALDATLGSAASGGITWVVEASERISRAIDKAMDRFDN